MAFYQFYVLFKCVLVTSYEILVLSSPVTVPHQLTSVKLLELRPSVQHWPALLWWCGHQSLSYLAWPPPALPC